MKVRQKVGKGLKSLVDFPRWMGWLQIKDSAKEVQNLAKIVMSPETAKHKETFEEAVKRLNLTDQEIKRQTNRHFAMFLIFLIMTLVLMAYSIYLLINHHYQGFLLGTFVGVLSSSFAFREHFYYFQMKTRRLGCTLKDWVDFVLGRAQK